MITCAIINWWLTRVYACIRKTTVNMNRSKETLNYHICGEGVKIENNQQYMWRAYNYKRCFSTIDNIALSLPVHVLNFYFSVLYRICFEKNLKYLKRKSEHALVSKKSFWTNPMKLLHPYTKKIYYNCNYRVQLGTQCI